jgi:hypothetical protein
MNPATTCRHQEVVVELTRQIATFLHGYPCRIFTVRFDVRSARRITFDTAVQRDLSATRDLEQLDETGCRSTRG